MGHVATVRPINLPDPWQPRNLSQSHKHATLDPLAHVEVPHPPEDAQGQVMVQRSNALAFKIETEMNLIAS